MDFTPTASSHGLLLRLLNSSFFSLQYALQYLGATYSDHVGISWELVRRMEVMDPQQLQDLWGLICHLLITRPSKSAALESFVIARAKQSTHTALMTLWFIQAYLRDQRFKSDSRSFVTCQRVLHSMHTIIFEDPVAPTPYSALSVSSQAAAARTLRKVLPNVDASIVGIGMMLCGAAGLPSLAARGGHIAIEQGRYDADGHPLRSLETPDADDDEEDVAKTMTPSKSSSLVDVDESSKDSGYFPRARAPKLSDLVGTDHPQTTNLRRSLVRRRTIGASQTSPSLTLRVLARQVADDPLGQQDPPSPIAHTPSLSTPSIHLQPRTGVATQLPETLLQGLLRSHYCRSEIQFIITLETIANRLLVVPKPARVSALRAELTVLNHKLPAEVCIPLWCFPSEAADSFSKLSEAHHRIVRIPPGECVVLNSAERAPYVLLIEILGGDLSFDPSKPENKDTLKKIVLDKKEPRQESTTVMSWTADAVVNAAARSALASETLLAAVDSTPRSSTIALPDATQTSSPVEEEEVDLVEQLYGSSLSVRAQPLDLAHIPLPLPPKNKDLDVAAWGRSPSVPPSPKPSPSVTANGHVYAQSLSHTPGTTPTSTNFRHLRVGSSPPLGMPQGEAPAISAILRETLSLDDYSERMRTAAVMLAQLNTSVVREAVTTLNPPPSLAVASLVPPPPSALSWLPGTGWITRGAETVQGADTQPTTTRMKLQAAEAAEIRKRIMEEMMTLEEERMERMKGGDSGTIGGMGDTLMPAKTAEDEGIIRRELNKVDPSATVFREAWSTKKARIRAGSPYGHLANWDVISVIVKTGTDLRQEQLALQLIQEFDRIWKEEKCSCWLRPFKILITGGTSGLVETITDAVSIHSIKKAEYARRLTDGRLGYVTLMDHFHTTYGNPSSARFARAQRNFAHSLAGYSLVTYFLQIKDRHNGNILLDTDGHCIHIDFGFMLSNSPGNVGFEAAPFKLTQEYMDLLGGVDGTPFKEFKQNFHEGFEAARKHADRIVSMVELMQKDSSLPCFVAYGDQTAQYLRDRLQPSLKNMTMSEHGDRLILTSMASAWTRLYDSFQYYSQSIL